MLDFKRGVMTVAAMALATGLGGCTSLKGEKLGLLSDGTEAKPTGIPYRLTRPEFVISRAAGEGGKAGKYTLALENKPDPDHLYAIRLDAAAFTDIDFVLHLGAGGAISSISSKTTEQLTPGITALGSFSKDLIGTLAMGVFDADTLRDETAKELAGTADDACQQAADVEVSALIVSGKQATAKTVGAVMAYRVSRFRDDDQFVELFHPASARELACLQATSVALDNRSKGTAQPLKEGFDKKLQAHLATYPKDSVLLQPLARAVDEYDSERIRQAVDRIKVEGKRLIATNGAAEAEHANSLDAVQGGAQNAADAVATTETAKVLESVVGLTPKAWLARHVLYLERELSDLQLGLLMRPSTVATKAAQHRRLLLEEARADALNARAQHERAVVLAAFLKSVPTRTDKSGSAPATSEYVTIRTELDSLLAQIEAKRARLLAESKPPAPLASGPGPAAGPAALDAVPAKLVRAQEIVDSRQPGWIDAKGKDAAEYVVVLEDVK